MKRPASWKTIRNRFKQHGRELAEMAAKHRGKVEVFGRLFTITGTFTSANDCNAWLEQNPAHGVIKEERGKIFTAAMDDKGQ